MQKLKPAHEPYNFGKVKPQAKSGILLDNNNPKQKCEGRASGLLVRISVVRTVLHTLNLLGSTRYLLVFDDTWSAQNSME